MKNVHTDVRVQRVKDKLSGLFTKSPGFSLSLSSQELISCSSRQLT